MSYMKAHSPAKDITVKGPDLENKVLSVMKTVSDIVGSTLGPGGRWVAIERQESGLPSLVSKDGVTVFRSLGFSDPTKHIIMELARDASVRTANEAGDGTTTATILAEAIIRKVSEFCKANPKVSPQRVVRVLEKTYREVLEPTIKQLAVPADLVSDEGRKRLLQVATISANGDSDLAKAVLDCYDLVGDNGNVTITELSGPSSYEVEKIEGFPIAIGYEDSCGRYAPPFVNEPGQSLCRLENPQFILYNGKLVDFYTLVPLLQQISAAEQPNKNIVVVASGFSDSVLAQLAYNFPNPTSLNIFPLLAPQSPETNAQTQFIEDLAAVTCAKVFDPVYERTDGPNVEPGTFGKGVKLFEAGRFRTNIVGHHEDAELLIVERADLLQKQIDSGELTVLIQNIVKERIGKLTGGIARLVVHGPSSGELREKRDRAEDAVCAVRGAMKHGCLPGGGWTLLKLASDLNDRLFKASDVRIVNDVLVPALKEPVKRLLENAGLSSAEDDNPVVTGAGYMDPMGDMRRHFTGEARGYTITEIDKTVAGYALNPAQPKVYDALEQKFVDPFVGGVLDSTPAVQEALRNSLSIATLLGTLGGAVVFPRDVEFERREAKEANEYLRTVSEPNEADARP